MSKFRVVQVHEGRVRSDGDARVFGRNGDAGGGVVEGDGGHFLGTFDDAQFFGGGEVEEAIPG